MVVQIPLTKDQPDPRSHEPLYLQVYGILHQKIDSGHYKPGDQLPSERDVTEEFRVSRITATAALRELVRSGVAYRVQGKGTFVAQPKIRGISSFGSFSEDIRQQGMIPSSRVLGCEALLPDDEARKQLGLQPDELTYRLARVRLANGDPVAIEIAYIPQKLCPDLEKQDLEHGSLYEAFRTHYGLYPTWAEGIIEAIPADDEQARLLDVEVDDPLLVVHRVTFDRSYVPLEWIHSVYRADRFSFSTGRQPIPQ